MSSVASSALARPRDAEMPPPSPLVGRLSRARANYFETFPVVIAALLIIGLLQLSSTLTAVGASLWLGARIIYLPLYASGVAVVRTVMWSVSFLGILLLLGPILMASIGF